MGTQINKGTTYADGQQVTFTNLNNHVDNATLAVGCITAQPDASALTQADTLLLQQGGTLRKATVAQMKTAMTLGDYLRKDGTVSMTTSSQLTLGTTMPLENLHAVPLKYLTSKYIPNSGTSSASGTLSFNGTLNVGTTTNMSRFTSAGIALLTTNQILTLSKDPVANLEATTKQYVDKYAPNLIVEWSGIFSEAASINGSYVNQSTTTSLFTCTSGNHGFIIGNRFCADVTAGANLDTILWTITSVTPTTFTASTLSPSVVANAGSGSWTIRKCATPSKIERGLTLNSIIYCANTTGQEQYVINFNQTLASPTVPIITLSSNGLTAATQPSYVNIDYGNYTNNLVPRNGQSIVFSTNSNSTGNKSGLVIF